MKKFIKRTLCAALAACMLVSAGAFVACGDGEEGDSGEYYVFEAEYTDFTGLEGLGPSGSPSGLDIIGESKEASNGFFAGQLGEDSPITFKFTSDKDATVTLRAIFGANALAPITWTSETFGIEVNGTAITYTEFKTETSTSSQQNFKTRTLGKIQVKKGENTIVFRPKNNKYLNNMTSAPSIDCIMLSKEATLTFNELKDNLN